MKQGRVRKAYNSFFYVEDTAGGLVPCKLRGKFKKKREICPGDLVDFAPLPDGTGVIEGLRERKSLLLRPRVANVSQVLLVFAARDPDPHPLLLSRFLVLAEWSGIPRIVLCFNKCDLAPAARETWAGWAGLGYPMYFVSAHTGEGLAELKENFVGQVTALAGPSGVGKSSLLNALGAGELATGAVSEKIKRGRHTTRVAELLPFAGGYLVDTPGFSAVTLEAIDPQKLAGYFPEMRPYLGECRFSPCSHSHEPGCAVKDAVSAGAILPERYEAYLSILQEIQNRKKDY